MELIELMEYRPSGTRNFIRVGDIVKVKSRPGKRDAFEARVRRICANAQGEVQEIEVVGGRNSKVAIYTVRPERIERVAQVRGGQPRERKR